LLLRSAEVKPLFQRFVQLFCWTFLFFVVGHLLEGWSFELCTKGDYKSSLLKWVMKKHFLHSQFPLEHPLRSCSLNAEHFTFPPCFLPNPKCLEQEWATSFLVRWVESEGLVQCESKMDLPLDVWSHFFWNPLYEHSTYVALF